MFNRSSPNLKIFYMIAVHWLTAENAYSSHLVTIYCCMCIGFEYLLSHLRISPSVFKIEELTFLGLSSGVLNFGRDETASGFYTFG